MDTQKADTDIPEISKRIAETRVLLQGYCQTDFHGVPKKRQIICGTDGEGSGRCGTKWFTLEVLEDQLMPGGGKERFPSLSIEQ